MASKTTGGKETATRRSKPGRVRRAVTRLVALALCLGAMFAIKWAIDTFLIAGAHTITVTVRGRDIEFIEPRGFYLAALVPIFWYLSTFTLSDLSVIQQGLALILRSALTVGVAIALARPTTVTEETKVATVILVDVSDSVSDKQLAQAQAYVNDAFGNKAKNDKLFVITFAGHPQTLPEQKDDAAPTLARQPGDGAATDIQGALQLAYGLFPPGFIPRAVVLSDGNQTSGNLIAEAYKAREFGVKISWAWKETERTKEIRVVALHLPEEVKTGQPFEVVAEIWSTHDDEVQLFLRQDDFPNGLDPIKKVKLHEGANRITFRSEAKAAGFVTYSLKMTGGKYDESKKNNETVASLPVKGRPRVLYIEGEYNRMPQVAGYLKKALDRENIDVEVRGPQGLPSGSKELERYDLVLVSDVPATFMGLNQMTAIENYVKDMGGGFIMAGGQDSFGSGGYQGTKIEKILPVHFDSKKEIHQPRVAMVLVIDRSGSMAGDKLEAAKLSARATVDALEGSDLVGVIAFDNSPTTVVRLQKASNKLRISTDIARLQPGGGTNILPALQEAYNVLAPANAKVKHVILLSDGQASYDGIVEVCDEMARSRITVSAVGIGDADRNLLSIVAEHGEGRLYMTDDLNELPQIFTKETEEAQKSSLVEEDIDVIVQKKVDMIQGVGIENAPPLHGYVSTKEKPLSEVILISNRGEPILARWRVGLGQVVAWTSDIKNRWGAPWLTWPSYPKFWAQVVRSTMRHKQHESYDLSASVVDGKAQVVVDAINREDRFVNGLDTTLEIIDPRDSKKKKSIPMAQTAAGRYEVEFPVDRYGTWILKAVSKRKGEVVAESEGSVAFPYPVEYLRSTVDKDALHQLATISGGIDDAAYEKVSETTAEDATRYHKDLWPYVLLAVACAFMLDLYLRRIRIFGYRAIKF